VVDARQPGAICSVTQHPPTSSALEHQRGQARPGEHRARGEPVVPGTHHDDVPSGACLRASQHFLTSGHLTIQRDDKYD
jgi:hypothetical protein